MSGRIGGGIARSAAGVVAAGVAGVAYAAFVETRLFALRQCSVPVLPAGAAPVRVLQVSDLHMIPGQARKVAWVRGLAELRPDFVVNSGDNLSHLLGVPDVLRAMEPLMEFPGAYVLGSNDYWAPVLKNPALYLTSRHKEVRESRDRLPVGELRAGFESGRWLDLNNARRRVLLGSDRLDVELVGVNDPHIDLDRYAAVAGPAAADAALTVGLVHAPYQRVLDAMTADGAGLVIAGHTHGGQLCVPGVGALVTNCDLDRSRAKGVSRWWPGAGTSVGGGGGVPKAAPSSAAPADAAWLHVSAGLGASRFAPVRFACRPEATLLTLTPRSS